MTRLSEQQARELLGDRYPELNKKAHKYNAKKKTVDGITFDSQKEARYYTELVLRKRAGEIKDFYLQPKFELQPGYVLNGKKILPIYYIADFGVIHLDDRHEIVDTKGMKTDAYKLKKKMLLYKYPELWFTEV